MTKPVIVTLSHDLGKREARRRIENSLSQIRAQLAPFATSIDHRWADDRLEFSLLALGQSASGHIDVLDTSLRIEVYLSGLLGRVAGLIAGPIRREGAKLLEKR